MTRGHIDYYFWLNSDWAYLGADRLGKRTGSSS
jgi:2-hydroxychromene-2-carboxylate isomerase